MLVRQSCRSEFLQKRPLLLWRDRHIEAGWVKFTGLFLELFQHYTEGLLLECNQLRHEQTGENAILLGHVPLDSQTARFLASDDNRLSHHERTDIFENDRCLVQLDAEQLNNGIELMAGGHGAN